MSLPFGYAEFDLVCCHRVLHHVRRPELAVSELARVARPGGKIFIADQLGSIDPMVNLEQDRFEHLRDATHQRLLPEADIRGFLEANDLVLLSSEVTREKVDLEQRLELAGFDEEERSRIRGPAPASPYEIEVGWYVARKSGRLASVAMLAGTAARRGVRRGLARAPVRRLRVGTGTTAP